MTGNVIWIRPIATCTRLGGPWMILVELRQNRRTPRLVRLNAMGGAYLLPESNGSRSFPLKLWTATSIAKRKSINNNENNKIHQFILNHYPQTSLRGQTATKTPKSDRFDFKNKLSSDFGAIANVCGMWNREPKHTRTDSFVVSLRVRPGRSANPGPARHGGQS